MNETEIGGQFCGKDIDEEETNEYFVEGKKTIILYCTRGRFLLGTFPDGHYIYYIRTILKVIE